MPSFLSWLSRPARPDTPPVQAEVPERRRWLRRPPARTNGIARRILIAMIVATVLPLLMFAAIGHLWLQHEAERRMELRLTLENRQQAALLQQRVHTAWSLLRGLADASGRRGSPPPPAVPGVLAGLVRVDTAGRVLSGSEATWRTWQESPSAEARDGTAAIGSQLRWRAEEPRGRASAVLLRADAADGGFWIAEVDPAFLWSALPEANGEVRVCVTDLRNRLLRCPQAEPAAVAEGTTVRRSLFWEPEFGRSQWVIATSPGAALGDAGDGGLLMRGLLLGGALTLVLAGGVGWLQWRDSAASLDRLVEGTQRWAAQEWDARVNLNAGDEFACLADALNLMADRIGHQVRAMHVQSAIDREILGGLDVVRVMDLVANRLQALLPRARVAVLIGGGGGRPWTSHRPGLPPVTLPAAPELPALPAGEWAGSVRSGPRMPAWAVGALDLTPQTLSHLVWVPATWQGQTLALLVLGDRGDLDLPEEACREITELRDRIAVMLAAAARESALLERAVLDGLTGLLNRSGLHDAIDSWLTRGDPFTLVLVDLDRFKEVNDTLGHQAGDELLCAVAERLRTCVAPQSRIARPGGDEFVLLLPGSAAEASASAMAICAELGRPFELRGVRQQIGGSLGLAAFPQHARNRGELMRRADLAMYVSKGEGRGRFSWYVEAMDERIARRAWMAQELRLAIDRAHFELAFQPRVEAVNGTIVCAEVLLRWPHAQRGLIPPGEFVPAAEESGMIDRLGHWVLASAFEQMRIWRSRGLPLQRIAVNVSPRQLKVAGFAEQVLDLLARYQLLPTDLELELTESLFAGDVDAVCRVLDPLRRAGIQLALDDFGTGYSSLSSLYRLPVDVIKIDHSFVRDLGKRPSAEIMARSIVALSKALRKRVVAEGVETRAQRDHLLRLDCDELQGFLYGEPLAAAQLERRLSEPATLAAPDSRSRRRTGSVQDG